MPFVVLKEESELREFASLTHKFLSIQFPIEYLQQSKVTAYIDDAGRMLGGYVLVLRGPFRVVESLPDEVKNADPRFAPENLEEGFEVTGLWVSPALRDRKINLLFWLRMYFDMLTLGRKWLIYAYSLDKPGLGRMYSIAKPSVVFRGETKILPGMPEPDAESVEVVNIFNLAKVPFTCPQFLMKRLLPRRARVTPAVVASDYVPVRVKP